MSEQENTVPQERVNAFMRDVAAVMARHGVLSLVSKGEGSTLGWTPPDGGNFRMDSFIATWMTDEQRDAARAVWDTAAR